MNNRKHTQAMINTDYINPEVKNENVPISDIRQSMSGRTRTHTVLHYVSGQKNLTAHRFAASSNTARIPPSRRGTSSVDISVNVSSPADAQLARCAAWSSMYNIISAMFCRATQTSRCATARIAWRSAAGHREISSTVCRDNLSSGRGSSADRRLEPAIQQSGTAGREGRCSVVEAPDGITV